VPRAQSPTTTGYITVPASGRPGNLRVNACCRGRLARRRALRTGSGEADGPGARHRASPCLARIILVTRSERAPLPITQQITPRARTARKTIAAIAGRPSPARSPADSIPAATRRACDRAPFTTPRPCDAVIATRRPSGPQHGTGGAHTAAASGSQPLPGQDPTAHSGTPPRNEPGPPQAGKTMLRPSACRQAVQADLVPGSQTPISPGGARPTAKASS
jgi:hypothetical protein